MDFLLNMLPPILPFLVRETGLSLALTGTLVSIYSLVTGLVQPFLGRLVERRGRGWMLPLSVVWVAGAMMLFARFDSFWVLAALVVAAGAGGAFYHPLAALMTRTVAGPSGPALSLFFLGGTAGMAVGPWLTAVAVSRWGRAGVAWAAASALLAAVVGWLGGLHRVQPAGSERGAASRGARAAAGGERGAPPGFVPRRARRAFALFAAANFLRVQAQVALTTFLPYLYVARGQPDEVGGRMLTLFFLAGSAGSLLGGWLGDRIGYRPVMNGSFVLSGVFLFAFFRWPDTHLFLALSAVALLSPFSVAVLYAQRLLPTHPGLAAGVMMGFIWGLAGLGLSAISVAADNLGVEAVLSWAPWLPLAAIPLMAGVPAPEGTGVRTSGETAPAPGGRGAAGADPQARSGAREGSFQRS